MNRSVFARRACAAIAFFALSAPAGASSNGPVLVPLRSFKMRMTDSTPQGSTSRVVTYVAPDKMRLEIVGQPTVVVAIARDVWLRGPNGQWQKAQYAAGVDPLTDVRSTFDLAQQLAGPGVHYRGVAHMDGGTVKIFDVDPPAKHGYEGRITRFWIGANDGYPHRIEQRKGPYVFTAIYSAWNQPLTVSAP